MTCQALWLKEVFGWSSLHFGFVMMATSVLGLTLRTLAYDWLQRKLGLMRCASFGALLSTAAYTGYSLVRRPAGFEWRFALFAASAACGTTGMILTSGSVAPFLSRLSSKEAMGRVMAVASVTASAGRVVGPPLYGRLYVLEQPLPYRVAAAFAAAAAVGYVVAQRLYVFARCAAKGGRLHAAPPPRSALAPADEAALGELQAMLRELLVARGYAIAASRLQLAAALEAAFPGLSPAADPEAVGGRKGVGAFRGEGRDPEGAEEEEEPLEATVHHSAAHHHHTCVHERERA
mmetsp:Transcript_27230/g.91645  ORF Transcript_27230/g.91645 Transcript_27230/m.91645 type:complete len:291 (+) Transcript_27230:1134-2006(+)